MWGAAAVCCVSVLFLMMGDGGFGASPKCSGWIWEAIHLFSGYCRGCIFSEIAFFYFMSVAIDSAYAFEERCVLNLLYY